MRVVISFYQPHHGFSFLPSRLVIFIRSGRSNGKGGVAVRGSFMPLYFTVIICTVFLSFLSSPDAVIGSVFARVIIRTVVLIFTGRSDMVYAFPSILTLLLPLSLPITYAWHYY